MNNSTTHQIKDLTAFYLSQIENEQFRFILFFRLSKDQVFLFNIFQSDRGFLGTYKGMQLVISKESIDIIDNQESYESNKPIKTNYPFLYGNFIDNSTFYIQKINFGNQCIGILEFVIKKDYISQYIKQMLNDLVEAITPYLIDLYIQIREDITKRYVSINSLNIIKNARPRTFYHSFRVADLAVSIAEKMNLDKKSQRNLCYASFIHDIGEMYIPRDIFYKEESLSEEEFNIVKQHPKNLKTIFSNNPLMEDVVEIAYYHHERLDGKGYYGFRDNEIPIESKILAVCEVIDGLYTDRPGRKGFDVKRILTIIKRSANKIFDVSIVNAAVEILNKYYVEREFDISACKSISNIGKPAVIVMTKEDKIHLIQGTISYISNNVIGISYTNKVNLQFSENEPIRVQFSFFDVIYDFKGKVISSADYSINILIKELENYTSGNLSVFWEFNIIAMPLRLSGKVLNTKESNSKFVALKTKRFGTNSLSAKAENPSIDLNIGDTVLLKMKPLKEQITIPAVVSNVIKEEGIVTVYFEYFSLPEKMDALIHQAIYYKQAK